MSIQYIHASTDAPYEWSLESHLLAFNRTVGRHTGKNIGEELVTVIRKFGFEDKVLNLISACILKLTTPLTAWVAHRGQCSCQ